MLTDSQMGDYSGTVAPGTGTSSYTGVASGAMSIVSSLSSIYSTYESGKLRRSISKHNALMAQFDAWHAKKAMEREKEYIAAAAESQIDKVRRTEARLLGTARAVNSASGFATSSKTNLDVEGDIMDGAALDVLAIRTNAINADLEATIAGLGKQRASTAQASQFNLEGELAKRETDINQANNVMKLGKTLSSLYR